MKTLSKIPVINFGLLLFAPGNSNQKHCYWCGQRLKKCNECKGKGAHQGSQCNSCQGTGATCEVHSVDWD